MIGTHKEMAAKLAELERKVASHGGNIKALFEAIRQLMAPPNAFSRPIRPLIPADSGHPFQSNPATVPGIPATPLLGA